MDQGVTSNGPWERPPTRGGGRKTEDDLCGSDATPSKHAARLIAEAFLTRWLRAHDPLGTEGNRLAK